MTRPNLAVTAALSAVLLVAGLQTASAEPPSAGDADRPDVVVLDVEMAGDQVAPEPVDTAATGAATAVLRDNVLTVGGQFADLSSPLRDLDDDSGADGTDDDLLDPGVHIHEGEPGATTGYVFGLPAHLDDESDLTARFSGSFLLSESQIATLLDGAMYLDVHTQGFEGGELRGQLIPRDTAAGVTRYEGGLDGESVVPGPVDSPATGRFSAFLEGVELTVGGEFSGLRSELRDQEDDLLDPGIHIHPGAAGEEGESYILALIADIDGDEGSGRFAGSFELDDAELELLRAENLFVDIHTVEFEDGEVRGQMVAAGDAGTAVDGAQARMHDTAGAEVGTVTYTMQGESVLVQAQLSGLDVSSDFRGFHLHESGVCDPADPDGAFSSAGGHWSPEGDDHSEHRGDMPSPYFTDDGAATLSFLTDRFTVAELLDGQVAQILHEQRDNFANIPDRYRSDDTGAPGPDGDTLDTGDAGDRMACGVVEPAAGDQPMPSGGVDAGGGGAAGAER